MPAVAAPCLLARSQPHRRSLLQGEEPHQEGEGEDAGSAIRGHRSGAGGDQQGGCPWLLRGLRLRGVSGPLIMKIALGVKLIAAENMDGLACVASVSGEARRAARLFGAARALHEAVGYHHTPAERAIREPYFNAVRSEVDEASWEEAFAEGRAMNFL